MADKGRLAKKAPHADLTYKIIGAAMAVHRRLGPGYKEQVYQNALEQEFSEVGLSFEPQKAVEVYDQDVLVGLYYLDFLVEGKVVVEIKALSSLNTTHIVQVVTYLTATGCPIGLLLNFGQRSLVPKRIFPPKKVTEHRINRQCLFIPDWLKEQRDPSPPNT